MRKMAGIRASCRTMPDPVGVSPAPRLTRAAPPQKGVRLRPDHLFFLAPELQTANNPALPRAHPLEPAR